jgi:cytochrome c2
MLALDHAAVTTGFTVAAAEGPAQVLPISRGEELFKSKGCEQCHDVWDTTTAGKPGPPLGPKATGWPDVMGFTAALWNHLPAIAEAMRARHIEPTTFSPKEMRALVSYLFFVKFVGDPGDATRGQELFDQRRCSTCHQFGGRGGRIGPRLDELKDAASVFFLARVLWNHGSQMTERMTALGIERPRLEATDVADLVAFVRGGRRRMVPTDRGLAAIGRPAGGEALLTRGGCVDCHAGSKSRPAIAPDLGSGLGATVSELAAAFWNHGPAMWSEMKKRGRQVPHLGDQEMADLLAFMAQRQYVRSAGDTARGAKIFSDKSCASCHAAGLASTLTASDATRSFSHWAATLWNHAPRMAEALQEAERAWPRLDGEQMRDLFAYLHASRDEERQP